MEEECKCPPAGAPLWMCTFSDLMSLLMCFFVLLLSFSEMDVIKFKQIAGSMKMAFGVQNVIKVKDIPRGTSIVALEFRPGKPDPTPIEVIRQHTVDKTEATLDFQDGNDSKSGGNEDVKAKNKAKDDSEASMSENAEEAPSQDKQNDNDESKLESFSSVEGVSAQHGFAQKVAKELRDEIEDGAIEIESLGQQIIIRIREKGSFPSGSAFLQPNFRPVIRKVASIIADLPGKVTVSGYSDNEPVQSELYRSSLELSAQRAVSVAQEMLKVESMETKPLVVLGYGGSKPLTEDLTKEGRRRNRRVEITILQGKPTESEEIGLD